MSDSENNEAKWFVALVKQRYGDRLDAEQTARVAKTIQEIRKMAATLRSVKLENSDEPATSFSTDR